jgi:hypothetical protein
MLGHAPPVEDALFVLNEVLEIDSYAYILGLGGV